VDEMQLAGEIRVARTDDASAIATLITLAYRVEDFFITGDRTDATDVRRLMLDGVFLVLEEGGVLVGAVYVKIRTDSGYFGMLSVDPSRQGEGLGRRLIEAAEQWCRTAGCTEMEIEVVSLRSELPPFYKRFGYVLSGTRPFDDAHKSRIPCEFLVMRKKL
jgi:GNAT superfamily N-acetyltransferase